MQAHYDTALRVRSRGPLRFQVDDDEQAKYVEAVLGALGYEVERADQLARVVQARVDELAGPLSASLRAVFHAMLVTDDAADVARMLGIGERTADYREQGVCARLGVRGRLDLLRMIAGINSAKEAKAAADCAREGER